MSADTLDRNEGRRQAAGAVETAVSVVVPTFNERENIAVLFDRLCAALGPSGWEMIVVDDRSPDGTAEAVRDIARRDWRIRLILRHNRRGLSSAAVEGALAAAGRVVVVMDGDLQHDETKIPELVRIVETDAADIAAASRFLAEGGADGLASAARKELSGRGIALANRIFGLDLTDPLTGFFAVRRDLFERTTPHLSELGFKILLDLIVSARPRPRVAEIAFRFAPREAGDSKLDERVLWEFFLFFLDKTVCRVLPVPVRFLSFAAIGGLGVVVHLAALSILYSLAGAGFAHAQLGATLVALFFNFAVNNYVTYFDRRLRGLQFVKGFLLFALVCSVGIVGNVSVATMLHDRFSEVVYVLPALAGILVSVAWNFGATRLFVWRR